jgi:hypothetical protein
MIGRDGIGPRLQVDAGERCDLVPRLQVVGRDGIAALDVVPVVRRELRLERHDAIGGCCRLRHAGKLQHRLHVRPEGGAGRVEVLEPVVALIGEREPALDEERHIALGIARIGLDVQVDERGDPVALQLADGAEERRDAVDRVDAGEQRLERRAPELGDPLGVHEARVEVADLARLGARLRVLGLLDDRPDVLLGLLGDQVERAPPRLVFRDLGAFDPRAVDVSEQVVLRADLGTELVESESRTGGFGHAFQDMLPRAPRRSLEDGSGAVIAL